MGDSSPTVAHGRALSDFGELSAAEDLLVKSCRIGEPAEVGNSVPSESNDDNRVRAGLIRFLALGGDSGAAVHEKGVHLQGAWIEGALDLEGVTIACPLLLWSCRMEDFIALRARIRHLHIDGSHLAGDFSGDDLVCESSLFLSNGFRCDGQVRLLQAKIAGTLGFAGGIFNNPEGYAILADRATVDGGVYLHNKFDAKGLVAFSGAEIGGDLDCTGAQIAKPGELALFCGRAKIAGSVFIDEGARVVGQTNFIGTTIGSDFNCSDGHFENGTNTALTLERARIAGSLFIGNGCTATGGIRLGAATVGADVHCDRGMFQNSNGTALSIAGARIEGMLNLGEVEILEGTFDLSSARVGTLSDTAESWTSARGRYVLDGFTYARIGGSGPVDAPARIKWLRGQSADHLKRAFRPQPWEQAISVLRAMGHPNAAREVAIAKQKQLWRAGRVPLGALPFHWAYGLLVGYGFKAPRLVFFMVVVWAACASAYWVAANPASVGLQTPFIAPKAKEPSAACLAALASAREPDACAQPSPDYSEFNPWVYSFDVLLPVINLGYRTEWQPVVQDSGGNSIPWGGRLRALYWFEIAFGWVSGLLLIGVLGNLIKKD